MIPVADWQPEPIEKLLGIHFKNSELLFQSLCHPSFAQQIHEPDYHNQRLGFLGDEILKLAIADYLYHQCPYLAVGNYKGLAAKLTSGEQLTKCWVNLGLGDAYPFLALKEERPMLAQKASNPFEAGFRALVGALYCDRGYSQTRNWLRKHLINPLLKKFLKKDTTRLEADQQLRYWGNAMLGAIAADITYHLLPGLEVKRLNTVHGQLTNKTTVRTYKTHSVELGNSQKLGFKSYLTTVYQSHAKETRNPFAQTRDWFKTNFVEEDEILEYTIRALMRAGTPQKWIIRTLLGYASKDYQAGRERFYEILEETPKDEEE
ncbi:MAG: ribonuclease III family protein [Spirulina sp. SIO3F2]|nr:ribonuclease III family protein [Spirulina sp. SIO3F2]